MTHVEFIKSNRTEHFALYLLHRADEYRIMKLDFRKRDEDNNPLTETRDLKVSLAEAVNEYNEELAHLSS